MKEFLDLMRSEQSVDIRSLGIRQIDFQEVLDNLGIVYEVE